MHGGMMPVYVGLHGVVAACGRVEGVVPVVGRRNHPIGAVVSASLHA